MIKLSVLDNNDMLIDDDLCIYTVEEIKLELKYSRDRRKKLYTTAKYKANIDAKSMIESAMESEYDNMYEDWYESVLNEITSDDIQKIQSILDSIFKRNESLNTAYYKDLEVEIDI